MKGASLPIKTDPPEGESIFTRILDANITFAKQYHSFALRTNITRPLGANITAKQSHSRRSASIGFSLAACTAGTAPKNRPTTNENTTVSTTMYQLIKIGTPDTRETT